MKGKKFTPEAKEKDVYSSCPGDKTTLVSNAPTPKKGKAVTSLPPVKIALINEVGAVTNPTIAAFVAMPTEAKKAVAAAVTASTDEAAFVAAQLEAQGGSKQDLSSQVIGQIEGVLQKLGLSGADRCALLAWMRGDKPNCPGARTIDEILAVLAVYSDRLPGQLRDLVAAHTKNAPPGDCGCGCQGAGACVPKFPWLALLALLLAPLLGFFG